MIKVKQKGSRAEREVKKILELEGCICSKSGASLGIWDLIAISSFAVRLIQVKSVAKMKWDDWKSIRRYGLKMEAVQPQLPACCRQEIWAKIKNQGWRIYWFNKVNNQWQKAEE